MIVDNHLGSSIRKQGLAREMTRNVDGMRGTTAGEIVRSSL
jgi:hypothetical protein